MQILVTGSQGTLGKKLVSELTRRGHNVFGCDLHHGEKNEIRADVVIPGEIGQDVDDAPDHHVEVISR